MNRDHFVECKEFAININGLNILILKVMFCYSELLYGVNIVIFRLLIPICCIFLGTLIDGKPIVDLPPKTIQLTKVDFSIEERSFYKKLEADSRSQFKVCLLFNLYYSFCIRCNELMVLFFLLNGIPFLPFASKI